MIIIRGIIIILLSHLFDYSYAKEQRLTVYSARKEHLIQPVFSKFEKKTGIKVDYLTGKSPALLERIKAEGSSTKADIFMTVDAGNLWAAAKAGLLAPHNSKELEKNIPAYLRDPGKLWFGISVRARTIVYNSKKVKPSELSTYESLADKAWNKRLCLRTSKKVYNQSLVAMLIDLLGEEKTEQIVRGWVKNLAVPVFSNDTRLMEGIIAGQCDLGIVNSYYFGRMQRDNRHESLRLYWPNQNSFGVHINISGAGLTKHAKHPENAKKLLDWLSTTEAQQQFAGLNLEYPANPLVEPDPLVKAWGAFKHSQKNIAQAGFLQANAIKLMDRVGYK